MNKLTNSDYVRAAELLNCEIAAIKAVAEVESRGGGFDSSGRVKILFERHKFYKYTDRKFRKSHPHLCNPNAGGYGSERIQYTKFNEAFALDQKAAMLSCSWGKFQIMGFNYKVCGFASVFELVESMKRGEGEQLLAFCSFVKAQNLSRFLKTLDWTRFASGYNGADYRRNRYDEKMADFYDKFRKEKINKSDLAAKTEILPLAADADNQPAAPTPAEAVSKEDSFLASALDRNFSPDELKTAARASAPRIIAKFARPFVLLWGAVEVGNYWAIGGTLGGILILAYLIYAHRADLKQIWETLKNKFLQ